MGYLSNTNGLKLAVSKSWTNKIIINKFNKDNFIINLIKDYNKIMKSYSKKRYYKKLYFKKNKFVKLKIKRHHLYHKTNKSKYVNHYYNIISRKKFSTKNVTKRYKNLTKIALKKRTEKFYSNLYVNFTNNKVNSNLNLINFKKHIVNLKTYFELFNVFEDDIAKRFYFFLLNKISKPFNPLFIKNGATRTNSKLFNTAKFKFKIEFLNKLFKIHKLILRKLPCIINLRLNIKLNFYLKIIEIVFCNFFEKYKQKKKLILKKLNHNFIILDYLKTRFLTYLDYKQVLINRNNLNNFKYKTRKIFATIRSEVLHTDKLFETFKFFNIFLFLPYKLLNFDSDYTISKMPYSALDSTILMGYVIKKLKKNYTYLSILLPLMKELKRNKSLLGFRINCKGRFDRKQRASHYVFKHGRLKYNNFENHISYDFNYVPLKFGTAAIKIWLAYKNSFYYNLNTRKKFTNISYLNLKNIKKRT